MCALDRNSQRRREAIRHSERSIYELLDHHPELFLDIGELQEILATHLEGFRFPDVPIRTRSKIFKAEICVALGYPIPKQFKRTQPRFPAQDFDAYVQEKDNLQIWNQTISATRRYVVARPDRERVIRKIKVVTGEALIELDKKGTLTAKYQASRRAGRSGSTLITDSDTQNFVQEFDPQEFIPTTSLRKIAPTDRPLRGSVLSIRALFLVLQTMIGVEIVDPGSRQERNRGIELQQRVCAALSLSHYADKGQWPDILSQALEIKLQVGPTIDLGLVLPNSTDPAQELGRNLQHRDVRYAVFYAMKKAQRLNIEAVVVTTGERFFEEFRGFEGKVVNRKLQIRLSDQFFS